MNELEQVRTQRLIDVQTAWNEIFNHLISKSNKSALVASINSCPPRPVGYFDTQLVPLWNAIERVNEIDRFIIEVDRIIKETTNG